MQPRSTITTLCRIVQSQHRKKVRTTMQEEWKFRFNLIQEEGHVSLGCHHHQVPIQTGGPCTEQGSSGGLGLGARGLPSQTSREGKPRGLRVRFYGDFLGNLGMILQGLFRGSIRGYHNPFLVDCRDLNCQSDWPPYQQLYFSLGMVHPPLNQASVL